MRTPHCLKRVSVDFEGIEAMRSLFRPRIRALACKSGPTACMTHQRLFCEYIIPKDGEIGDSPPSYVFRTEFDTEQSISWFPGHMKKAIRDFEREKLRKAHVIIELRDARIPFSSANKDLDVILKGTNKPRIIVLNKTDLAFNPENPKRAKRLKRVISDKLRSTTHNCSGIFFIQANAYEQNNGIDSLIKCIKEELPNRFKMTPRVILVAGIPNCGKSSLINALRMHSMGHEKFQTTKVAGVGAVPAFTREFSMFRLSRAPPVYIFDSPGIMIPRFVGDQATESALRLALCGAIKDDVADPSNICDYMIYWMNKHGKFEYTRLMRPSKVSDSIDEVLFNVNTFLGGRRRKSKVSDIDDFNYHNTSRFLLRKFRAGDLGSYFLDEDYISDNPNSLTKESSDSLFSSDEPE